MATTGSKLVSISLWNNVIALQQTLMDSSMSPNALHHTKAFYSDMSLMSESSAQQVAQHNNVLRINCSLKYIQDAAELLVIK